MNMQKRLLFATVLLFGFPFFGGADFSDISEETRYAEDIQFISEKGIVRGYTDGTYRPEQTITRAEFTKILLLSHYSPEDIADCTSIAFPDASPGEWYISYLCFAKEKGIINGFLDGTFGPNENITYSAAAKIIVNTLFGRQEEGEGENWWYPFSQILSNENAIPVTIKGGDHLVTRGEMAHMIAVLLRDQEKEAEKSENTSEEEKENNTTDSETSEENGIETDIPQKTYTSDKLGLSFSYLSEYEGKEVSVFEVGTKVILAIPDSQNNDDFAACVGDGLCSEQDGEHFSHVDTFYVLTKSTQDEDFPDAILRKIGELGKNPDDCNLQVPPYSVEGWSETRLSVAHPKTLDENMSEAEKRNAEEREAVDVCSFYAAGYGRSFFLFNPDASDSYFLYLPSFGEKDRVVQYETLVFEKN